MMRTRLAVTLALLLTSSSASAQQASSWEALGGYLKQACSVGQTSAGNGDKLQWICNIASTYGFLTTNVLNGDWQAFGQEVMGQYMSQAAEYMGQKLGFAQLNQLTADMNNAMQGSYNDFRGSLYNAMTQVLKTQNSGMIDDNAGSPVTSPGGLADYAVKNNPFLVATQTAGRTQQTLETFEGLLRAAQAKKITEQNAETIETAMKPAMQSATATVGNGITPGFADKQVERGKTALSQRELLQVQLETQAYALKQDASMRIQEFQLLVEIAKQGVMTNTQLIAKLGDVSNAMDEQNNYVKQAMEVAAQDNLDAAQKAAREYTQYVAQLQAALDPRNVQSGMKTALAGGMP
ncbi:hypothetical protein [Deinococcus humi]|uniref:Uncharacterized protein n=1 Tax=Deinococcus humi TaxID=662880 RepID=A0A7W8JZ66_9DEIO|nr:hypothetical protein [Deinococcus humi]MBB5365915.1 hypothetical protein [Deinococcus humi]GGO40458.1 hypothetical protein GCM10008949_50000 [Deinococcus humi]